jgi:tetratricopeptide (TPR) repeat protein
VNAAQIEALARATMAHALTQLAIHFPHELDGLGMTVPEALERALGLAEEAIAGAPEMPDGHTALGRLLLCHDGPDAVDDALDVLRHAEDLDPEHDPAVASIAVALREKGETAAALRHVEQVIRRGSGQAQPIALRALLHLDAGDIELARRDLERAVRIAPNAGILRLDAARVAEMSGDAEGAATHRERARQLLGAAYELAAEALDRSG